MGKRANHRRSEGRIKIMFEKQKRVDYAKVERLRHDDPERQDDRKNFRMSERERIRFLNELVNSTKAGITVQNYLSRRYRLSATYNEGKNHLMAYLMDNPPKAGLLFAELYNLSEQGITFAEACYEFPGVFDGSTLMMIAAAEKTGNYSGQAVDGMYVPGLLERHVRFLEKMSKVWATIKSELILPVLTLVVAGVVLGIMLKFVIPVLKNMFAQLGDKINPVTTSLIWLGEFIDAYWWLLIILSVAIPYGYSYWKRKDFRVKQWESYWSLRIPVINRIVVRIAGFQYVGVLSGLVSATGEIKEAVTYAAASIGNLELRSAALKAADDFIIDGKNLADKLADYHPAFGRTTPLYASLKQYESTGSTGDLDNLQRELEGLVDESLERLVKLIEPVMKIVLGIIVGYIVIGMYMPLLQLVGTLAGGTK